MHVVFRESRGLEDTEVPTDPDQSPADMVVLSFSDSDLGAFAAGWHRAKGGLPALRLCNLATLRHPVSVDTYIDKTLAGAKAVLVRLIGGEAYWPYGIASVQDLARRQGIALAILPADGRPDPRLTQHSTLPATVLNDLAALCDEGGAVAAQMALARLAQAAGLTAAPVSGRAFVPQFGFYDPDLGVLDAPKPGPAPILVSFYRSYLTAADMRAVDAVILALREEGFTASGVFAPSLKADGFKAWLAPHLVHQPPAAIVNMTAFSAQSDQGGLPFELSTAPVFQVALSTAQQSDWETGDRGLSAADLAMHVVLPEVDGRIFLGAVSFKAPEPLDPALEFSRLIHQPHPQRIAAVVARIKAWHRLAQKPPRRALILSTYPGKTYQLAHAVGLDALASAAQISGMAQKGLAQSLQTQRLAWRVADYLTALAALPQKLQDDLHAAWGDPALDTSVAEGHFHFAALQNGDDLIALQPERGTPHTRADDYHDLTRTPCHGYVAFYLWLQSRVDAIVHIGAHGTLEWLPGKAVALSQNCWPEALTGALPVIYPFIVNDPGEAAQAKRRVGAVVLGHLPPPLAEAALPENLTHLERLLDEYSTADGLDPRRRDRLIGDIRDEARAAGVESDLGLYPDAAPAEAIPLIDRFVCDLKESRFGEGLHIFGSGACGAQELAGLKAALAGARVAAGPSGSPARGRADVLPTGRNLYTIDPRAVPTRSAHAQGIKLAEEVLRRHLQDHGDWPKGLVIDLWGSATMRTAGEEFAMALHLAGLSPQWDTGSGRVSGLEVIPLALLGRPRIDVTLRVSGLFRDVFPGLAQIFDMGAQMLAQRDEPAAENPYLHKTARVFGPKPGLFGLAMGDLTAEFTQAARDLAGEAWLAASSHTITADGSVRADPGAIKARLAGADAFVHAQDLPEGDLLLAQDYAAHEAGFAAAMARIGAPVPAIYHLDITRPDAPRARALTEEIARVTRARAANPLWVRGMMAHGFRGGAEIAATLDHMAAFAHLAGVVPPHLFDLYHDATLGQPEVAAFLEAENPAALAAMRDLFLRLHQAGLWQSRRNSILADLEAAP